MRVGFFTDKYSDLLFRICVFEKYFSGNKGIDVSLFDLEQGFILNNEIDYSTLEEGFSSLNYKVAFKKSSNKSTVLEKHLLDSFCCEV